MSDLDDLKQRLYAKLQVNSTPEKPLIQEDLLKRSEMPTYQAHQRLRQEIEQQRLNTPDNVIDVAQGELSPIKGKTHSPKPAFDATDI
jgi:hypothetical protein